MKRMQLAACIAASFLIACDGSFDVDTGTLGQPTTNNQTTGSNNGTTGENNGVGNNGVNNGVGNNGTTGSNNGTTAGPTGQQLFAMHCGACHGANGNGNPQIWDINIQGYEPIADIVKLGRGTMEAVVVTDEEIDLMQAYLLTQGTPISELNGEQLFGKLCANCHGPQGEGTATRGYQLRYDDDPFSAFWTRNGRGTSTFDTEMPLYPMGTVSDQQLDEMFTFVNSAAKPTDGEGLYNQYCANCHALDGSGGPSGEGVAGRASSTNDIRGGHAAAFSSRQGYMTAWDNTQLTDAEVNMINTYVSGL